VTEVALRVAETCVETFGTGSERSLKGRKKSVFDETTRPSAISSQCRKIFEGSRTPTSADVGMLWYDLLVSGETSKGFVISARLFPSKSSRRTRRVAASGSVRSETT